MLQQNGAAPMPSSFVGKSVTNNRIKRFIETKHQLLSSALGKEDTRAIWYSKDHVAQWLEEIHKADADGMRIYFGVQGENEDYPGQLCLLMVLTRADSPTGGHIDITVENATDFEARSISINDAGPKKRDFNTGSPCPPICEAGMRFPE